MIAAFPRKILATLKSPGQDDGASVEPLDGALRCTRSGRVYPFVDGVPSLLSETVDGTVITDKVKAFYERNPFPNYEGLEEFGDLVNKGQSSAFSRGLLNAIGYNKLVLECGCGTGQLSHFLQLNNNRVLGVDMSIGSLRLAMEHKRCNHLSRSSFCQMNLFDLGIKDASFDVVIAHGVLHHTFDAGRAFASIARKAKPGGVVVVGLYNSYARIPSWIRGKLIRVLGPRIDYVVRNRIRDLGKADIWIKDQYYNPHETWHSIDEVMTWFDKNGIDYLNCVPGILDTDGEDSEDLFADTSPGGHFQRVVTQVSWLGTIAREGALFDLIGRRRA